ncbi:MAG: hypothetical protein MJZ52_07005 [Bacteroidales bacterium]|nr:hypothetical protein [Bacteroidales bacterium]
MRKYLMKCGHVANATTNTGKPCCVICAPDVNSMAIEKECEGTDGLEGRIAKCSYCSKETTSRWSLPFFNYRPTKNNDEYYCGCGGWD